MNTTIQQKQIIAAINYAINLNVDPIQCYGGCARIYIQGGGMLTIDEMMSLTIRQQSSLKKQRRNLQSQVLQALEGIGFKIIRGRAYIGYDNNTKKEYSLASAIVESLKAIGVQMEVVAEED